MKFQASNCKIPNNCQYFRWLAIRGKEKVHVLKSRRSCVLFVRKLLSATNIQTNIQINKRNNATLNEYWSWDSQPTYDIYTNLLPQNCQNVYKLNKHYVNIFVLIFTAIALGILRKQWRGPPQPEYSTVVTMPMHANRQATIRFRCKPTFARLLGPRRVDFIHTMVASSEIMTILLLETMLMILAWFITTNQIVVNHLESLNSNVLFSISTSQLTFTWLKLKSIWFVAKHFNWI